MCGWSNVERLKWTWNSMLTLADIVEGIGGRRPVQTELEGARVQSVEIDSRRIVPGSVFVALKGERQDGHAFIQDALTRGAIGVIAERIPAAGETPSEQGVDHGLRARVAIFDGQRLVVPVGAGLIPLICLVDNTLAGLQKIATYWRRRHAVVAIGITGSVGKTSTKELVWSVLRQRFHTLKSEGSYNNEIGLPLTLMKLTSQHQRVVLEMGMYAIGEIAQLATIAQPRIGVVTNVGPTHLERLGTLERIAQAKAELVQALPADGWAILNGDDPVVRRMASQTRAQVMLYGLTPDCNLWASGVDSHGLKGISFWLHHNGDVIHAKIPLLGRHSVHTALRATAVGLVEGLTWQEIMEGLQNVAGQVRLIVVPGIRGSTLLDDTYNASPDSVLAALNLLSEMGGRRIAVLGDMLELGEYEEAGHRKVGCRTAETADMLVAVGANRNLVADEALACGMHPGSIHRAVHNQAAFDLLRQLLAPGDFVLFKGSRGVRMEELVAALSMTNDQ